MNANQFRGSFKSLVGKVQEQTGHLLGSRRQVLRGLQRQVIGAADKRLGDFQLAAQCEPVTERGIHR